MHPRGEPDFDLYGLPTDREIWDLVESAPDSGRRWERELQRDARAQPRLPRAPHDHSNESPPHFLFHRARIVAVFFTLNALIFPLEHFLWEKAPLFRDITEWMGL